MAKWEKSGKDCREIAKIWQGSWIRGRGRGSRRRRKTLSKTRQFAII